MRFEGKRVLITGGSGGLGRHICFRLAERGALLTVIDRSAPSTVGVAYVEGDLATAEGLEALASRIANEPWDVLINLAGVQYFGPLERQDPERLVSDYMVNLVAPARLIQAVLPKMKAQRFGRIVNIGSIFGSINFAYFASYSSAKAGLKGLSQALRRELAHAGIGVTYIAPRAVRTALNSAAVRDYATLTKMTMDHPEEIADRIVQAIERDRLDVFLGFPESLFVRINALFPRLVDQAVRAKDLRAGTLFAHKGASS